MSLKSAVLRFLKATAVEEAHNLRELAVKGVKQLAEQELETFKTNHAVLVNDLNRLVDDLKKTNQDVQQLLFEKSVALTNTESELVKHKAAVKKADEIAAKALQSLKKHPELKVQVAEHVNKSKKKTFSFVLLANDKAAFVCTAKLPLRDIEILASTLGVQLVRQETV